MAVKNAPVYQLLTYKDNARCMKIRLTAAYAGVRLEEPEFDFGKEGCDNKTGEFLRRAHPLGKVPVLKTPEGYIFESFAITRYLARLGQDAGLYGKTPYQMAEVDQWMDFASSELSSAVVMLVGPLTGLIPYNAAQSEQALRCVKNCFTGMDTWLEIRTYFVSERLTAADIVLVCTMLPLFQFILTPDTVRPYPHLTRWFNLCINQPLFQSVLEPGALLENASVPEGSPLSPTPSPSSEKKSGKKKKKAEKNQTQQQSESTGGGSTN
eukprot:TRINITY_DN4335_c0_g1_i1.p1 TRINITY_DN4335_c0_g1~~TRINITY_DN4335_c0_g1_i1.p1  ORF type:complete len:282 (+),score=82.60 TRINITY_DN4335_c0_g1_i1:46-846(+)